MCDDGGIYFATTKKCYQLYKELRTWHEARVECLIRDGDLVTIANKATQEFVEDNFKFSSWKARDGGKHDGAWLGGFLRLGNWTWADGTPWTGFDLNTQHDGQEYLFIKRNYKWADCSNSCNDGFHYLCQFDLQ